MTKIWHETCFVPILLFDPSGAILPPRPQFDCAIVSSGGQGWPRFSRPPEGLVLDGGEHDGMLAALERKTGPCRSAVVSRHTAIILISHFRFPHPLQNSGSGSGKSIKIPDQRSIKIRGDAHTRELNLIPSFDDWSPKRDRNSNEGASRSGQQK